MGLIAAPTHFKDRQRGQKFRGVHNILLVRVCVAQMGGFWPLNSVKRQKYAFDENE